jgi:trimethylamine--corrinoid protein Co-methyltransferase
VKRFIQGFDINSEQIGMNTIRQVGPGGNFLTADQTLKLFRKVHWRPKIANRDILKSWQDMGSKNYGELATQKAIRILKTHKSEPLSDDIRQTIDTIRKKAGVDLSGKHLEA